MHTTISPAPLTLDALHDQLERLAQTLRIHAEYAPGGDSYLDVADAQARELRGLLDAAGLGK